MNPFSERSTADLKRVYELYPWFSALRRELILRSELKDELSGVVEASRHYGQSVSLDADLLLKLSSDEIIDRFLDQKDLRIVAESGEPDGEVVTEADLDDEDDLVSEDLAQVYINQGLYSEAIAIYRRLSLQNPEKSVYFAEIIEELETKN